MQLSNYSNECLGSPLHEHFIHSSKQTVLEGKIICQIFLTSHPKMTTHIETQNIKDTDKSKLGMNAQLQWGASAEQATDTLKGIKGEHRGERVGRQTVGIEGSWHPLKPGSAVRAFSPRGRHGVSGKDRWILGASWPMGVAQTMTPDSVRDPASKSNMESNRGRHVTLASRFHMHTLAQVGTPVFTPAHTHRKKV